MLVGHLTLPVTPPAAQPPVRVENPEPVDRSVVLTPLQAPTEARVSAPLRNPNPQQAELRQTQRSNASGHNSDRTDADEADAQASAGVIPEAEAPVAGVEPQDPQADQDDARRETSPERAEPARPEAAEPALDEQDLEVVRELAARDREVRAHEQAHAAVGGSIAGAANFSYPRGPDGRQYAVGGEVSIDTSPVPNNPEATIRKAQQIRRAAQEPANPSAQDRQVAARAIQMEIEARLELARERREAFRQDDRSTAAIDMYEALTKIGRNLEGFPDLEQVIDDRA